MLPSSVRITKPRQGSFELTALGCDDAFWSEDFKEVMVPSSFRVGERDLGGVVCMAPDDAMGGVKMGSSRRD